MPQDSKGPWSRRTFLKASGAAALPATATPKRIRTAVYGIANGHAKGKVRTVREMDDFELVGICEPDKNVPRDHKAFQGVEWLTEPQMLDDPSIDLVVVESDVPELLTYAHRAVEAGKWVHMDKPPGDDLERFNSMLADAAKHGRGVQMGYKWRYHPAMSAAIEAAREGWLGEVYMMRSILNKPLSAEQRRPLARYRGGIMFIEGCHMIDRTLDLLGRPKAIKSWVRHDGPLDDGMADNNLAVLEFEGALAEIYMAALQPNGNQYRTFEILGANGTATVRPYFPAPYKLYVDLKNAAGPYKQGVQLRELPDPEGPPFVGDFTDLAKIIRGEMKTRYTPEFDRMTHEVLLMVCQMRT